MFEKMEALYMQIMMAIQNFFDEEEGDTNFISILIMLAIVILLATMFIGFKDTIIDQVQGIVEGFTIQ